MRLGAAVIAAAAAATAIDAAPAPAASASAASAPAVSAWTASHLLYHLHCLLLNLLHLPHFLPKLLHLLRLLPILLLKLLHLLRFYHVTPDHVSVEKTSIPGKYKVTLVDITYCLEHRVQQAIEIKRSHYEPLRRALRAQGHTLPEVVVIVASVRGSIPASTLYATISG